MLRGEGVGLRAESSLGLDCAAVSPPTLSVALCSEFASSSAVLSKTLPKFRGLTNRGLCCCCGGAAGDAVYWYTVWGGDRSSAGVAVAATGVSRSTGLVAPLWGARTGLTAACSIDGVPSLPRASSILRI